MRQVQIDRYGGPEVLQLVEVPDPVPGPGEVLVRTEAAGITFVDTQSRAGRDPRPGPPPALPRVLGNGVAGLVTGVGAGVDSTLVSRRVVTATGGAGGYADRVVVPADGVIEVPNGVDPATAVALLADGRTALSLVRAAAITPADRVLITAAAGGVGSLLVQLVTAAGAREVVAAAGGERKLSLARQLSAGRTVDYTREGWAGDAGDVDVAFDGVGGAVGQAAFALVVPEGRFLGYGMASGAWVDVSDAGERDVTVVAGHTLIRSPEDNRALVEQALAAAATGRLWPVIGQTFPLSRAADAHAAIEARATIGKTVLVPDG